MIEAALDAFVAFSLPGLYGLTKIFIFCLPTIDSSVSNAKEISDVGICSPEKTQLLHLSNKGWIILSWSAYLLLVFVVFSRHG